MKILIQMDHPSGFKPATDSTFALALEAQRRGHELFYFLPEQLLIESGEIKATARAIRFEDRETDFYTEGDAGLHALESADVILIRQEPPYDMQYLTGCWLLERLQKPLILNNPAALRRRPEKLFPLALSHYAPDTLISYDEAAIRQFLQRHRDIVLKPLYAHGGIGIIRLKAEDEDRDNQLAQMLQHSREPVIAQPFLPEVMTEEKRVLLLDGEITAAYNRIPLAGDFRANNVLGAGAAKTTLTRKQTEICHAVGEICKNEGFFFVGLDLIGDYLIEVNTTCPTGIRRTEMLYGTNPAVTFWDKVEAKK